MKYPDKHSAGSSDRVPFIPDEDPKDRHARRLHAALKDFDKVVEWCVANRWELDLKNRGQHWVFTRDKCIVEWWPSSAKLVIDKNWNDGIHCHDYNQALVILHRVDGEANEEDRVEQLAPLVHEIWRGWMSFMAQKCTLFGDGSILIPTSYVAHWLSQIERNYSQLTEEEKESDRDVARQILDWIERGKQ